MGYTTNFRGKFEITPGLADNHRDYLLKFAKKRHVKLNVDMIEDYIDPTRLTVDLPLGVEGEFYTGDDNRGIINNDDYPSTQPALYCQWIPTEDGCHLEWDGREKFYGYLEWLNYYILNFFIPWGYTLNGDMLYFGGRFEDYGRIQIYKNHILLFKGEDLFKFVSDEWLEENLDKEIKENQIQKFSKIE